MLKQSASSWDFACEKLLPPWLKRIKLISFMFSSLMFCIYLFYCFPHLYVFLLFLLLFPSSSSSCIVSFPKIFRNCFRSNQQWDGFKKPLRPISQNKIAVLLMFQKLLQQIGKGKRRELILMRVIRNLIFLPPWWVFSSLSPSCYAS